MDFLLRNKNRLPHRVDEEMHVQFTSSFQHDSPDS